MRPARLFTLVLLAAIVATVSSMLTPSSLVAQLPDCGLDCQECGPLPDYWEGYDEDPLGDNDMACPSTPGETCNACDVSVAEVSISQEAIGRALVSSRVSEVPALIAAYGDRLLLSDTRNLVAIKGNACGSDALGVWVTVSSQKMAALRTAELGSLEDVLTEQAGER